MLAHNWMHNLALRGCLIAGIGLLSYEVGAQELDEASLEGEPVTAPQRGKIQNSGHYGAGGQTKPAPDPTPALQGIQSAIRDLIAAIHEQQDPGQPQREIADLQAQQNMSRWAKPMFWAAAASVVVTFGGLLLIWRTLHHTRRAADYTKGMLEQARKTTKAAIASTKAAEAAAGQASRANQAALDAVYEAKIANILQEKSAKRQLRAYVLADGAMFLEHPENNLWVGVFFKNTGQTPAWNAHARLRCAVIPTARIEEFQFRNDNLQSMGVIGPNQGFTARFLQSAGNDLVAQWAAIKAQTVQLYIWGKLTYIDAFGRTQETTCRFRYSPTSDDFVPCEQGNEAT